MGNRKFDKKSFFDTLVQGSIRAIKKEPIALDSLYNGYRTLVENQKIQTPEREQECNELLQILEKSYRMFSDSEVENIIISNNVSAKQFVSKYGERILGNKRKYDMSDRFNPSLISYQDKSKQSKKIVYVEKEGIEHTYLDIEGKTVSIQEIGKIGFEEWNGVSYEIPKYRVTRQIGKDVYRTDEIFSNIRIIMMDNPEYREAVLEELLSEKNIELSNAGGYVGDIEEVTIKDTDFKKGSEKIVAGDYFYRVSPKYMLAYHSEKIAAAKILSAAQKNAESKKIVQIMDNSKFMKRQNITKDNSKSTESKKIGGDSR